MFLKKNIFTAAWPIGIFVKIRARASLHYLQKEEKSKICDLRPYDE